MDSLSGLFCYFFAVRTIDIVNILDRNDNLIVVSRIDARVLCACPKIAFGVEPEFLEAATSNSIKYSKVMVYSYRRRRQGIGMDSAIRGPGARTNGSGEQNRGNI